MKAGLHQEAAKAEAPADEDRPQSAGKPRLLDEADVDAFPLAE